MEYNKKITNNTKNLHSNRPIEININGISSTNSIDIANAINDYFTSVADNLIPKNSSKINIVNNDDPMTYLGRNFKHCHSQINLVGVTTHEINKIINSLKNKTSHGYDEISNKILKASAPYTLSPLTYIFNKVLSTGIYPNRLKYSEIQPLYKKGEKTKIANYRPISFLSSFSKIIEKVIYSYKGLNCFLIENNILTNEQFGFREKSTTDMATYASLNNIQLSLEKKLVGGIFCDLQKAFDCVNHDKLLQKLKYYGITDVAFKLLKSYLSNRYQRTVIKTNNLNKPFSSWKIIKCGVPQGPLLGPLLFLIYINDLPVSISKTAKSILFADDTSITITNENKTEFRHTLQLAMTEISNCFQSNRLTLNYEKTHFLHFVTKKQAEIQQLIVISNTVIKKKK